MRKNKCADLLFPVLLMAFSLYIFIEGRTYRGNDKYFPMIIGVLVFACAFWMLVEELRKKTVTVDLSKVNWGGIVVAVLAMGIYVVIFPIIGYAASTFLLGFCVIRGLGYKSLKGAVLWPAGLVAVVFVIFKVLLKVPLPTLFL